MLKENESEGVGKAEVKTPGRKVRKLTARKWDLMDEREMDEYGEF